MVIAVQHFIYPLSERGGYEFDGGRAITPENFWSDALKGRHVEWGISTGFRLVQPDDWVWAYFSRPVGAIVGVGKIEKPVSWREDWQRHSIQVRWNPTLTEALQSRPIPYESYGQRVQVSAVRASDATRAVLEQWLNSVDAGLAPGQEEVKFAERSVNQRLGQAVFRAKVLQAYGGACAFTGCTESSVLQAAHIVPVAAAGSHDMGNALLLRADVHNLFDLGLITATAAARISVADSVTDREYRQLQGRDITFPRSVRRRFILDALSRHRSLHGH